MGEVQTLTTTADVSSVIIAQGGSQKFCAQPAPDAVFNEREGFSFSLVTVTGNDEDTSEKDSSSSDEMQGRVPAVLLAREMLYRLCELSINNPGQLDKILPIYEQTLNVIEAGWLKESERYVIQDSLSSTESVANSDTSEPEPAARAKPVAADTVDSGASE